MVDLIKQITAALESKGSMVDKLDAAFEVMKDSEDLCLDHDIVECLDAIVAGFAEQYRR